MLIGHVTVINPTDTSCLHFPIEMLLYDDVQVFAEVDVQGPWFDLVRKRIYQLKVWLKIYAKVNSKRIKRTIVAMLSNTSCTPKMKLSKTDLRKFRGDDLDWPEFWDLFRVDVHDNPEIPPIQKFVYLKSLLTGEAAGHVANIKTEEANYDIAVQHLLSH